MKVYEGAVLTCDAVNSVCGYLVEENGRIVFTGNELPEKYAKALAACAKFRKVTWAMLLFSADTLADPHKYQEREWGKTSISIALELALDAVLSVVEE